MSDHAEGDIQDSFVQWPSVFLVSGGIASAILYRYDDNVVNYFSKHGFSQSFDKTIDIAANPYLLSSFAAVTYGASLLTGNERFHQFTETISEAMIFEGIVSTALKYTFRRTRPNGASSSFPSGDTSTAFTIASVFEQLLGWKYGIPAYTVAGIIGLTRLDGNHHHLTDVIFAAGLGTSIGLGTARFHKQSGTKLLIAPILDQTRGLMVTYKFS